MKRHLKFEIFSGLFVLCSCIIFFGCGKGVAPSSVVTKNLGLKATAWTAENSVHAYGNLRAVSSCQALNAGSISGHVYDALSGNAIANANIYINSSLIATTDANGSYLIANIAAEDQTITAIDPTQTFITDQSRSVYNHASMSVITSASKVDFKLFPLTAYASAGKGTVNVNVVNENGQSIEGASVFFSNQDYKQWFEGTGNTNSQGNATLNNISIGNVCGTAGKVGLGGGFMSAPVSLAPGVNVNAKIIIPSNQGTISGLVNTPTGLSLTNAYALPSSEAYPMWYMATGTIENMSSYSVKTPAGNNDGILLTASSIDDKKIAWSIISGITLASGETLNKNVTLLEPPSNAIAYASQKGGLSFYKIIWNPPASWTPGLYLVYIFSYNPGFSWFGITKSASIEIPSSISIETATQAIVFAVKPIDNVSSDNFNLLDLGLSDLAADNFTHLSLTEKLDILVARDPRISFYNYTNKEAFLAAAETQFGIDGTDILLDSMLTSIDYLNEVEAKYHDAYGVNQFFKNIRLWISPVANSPGGDANADDIKIYFAWPSYDYMNRWIYGAIAHEYGHFLSFHDHDGNIVIPPNSDSWAINSSEMATNGIINRYHLKNMYFLPFLTTSLTTTENMVLMEVQAHKMVPNIVSSVEAQYFFETLIQGSQLYMNTAPTESILALLFFAHLYNYHNYDKDMTNLLLTRSEITGGEPQIQSCLASLESFYNRLELYNY